jgi:hypothetical protein
VTLSEGWSSIQLFQFVVQNFHGLNSNELRIQLNALFWKNFSFSNELEGECFTLTCECKPHFSHIKYYEIQKNSLEWDKLYTEKNQIWEEFLDDYSVPEKKKVKMERICFLKEYNSTLDIDQDYEY